MGESFIDGMYYTLIQKYRSIILILLPNSSRQAGWRFESIRLQQSIIRSFTRQSCHRQISYRPANAPHSRPRGQVILS
jgi:hypothetical protein